MVKQKLRFFEFLAILPKTMPNSAVFPSRLKAARLRAGLTQMQLGVLAQIDEYSASARINQYERGKHQPDYRTAERLASVLSVPLPYFFASDENLARLILFFGQIDPSVQGKLLDFAIGLIPDE